MNDKVGAFEAEISRAILGHYGLEDEDGGLIEGNAVCLALLNVFIRVLRQDPLPVARLELLRGAIEALSELYAAEVKRG